MAKWTELAEEILGSGDKIKRSYRVKFNDKMGYLITSNQRLLFLEEKGYIRLNYSKILELPYTKISSIKVTSDLMQIISSAGDPFNFTEAKIKGLMQRVGWGAEKLEIIGKDLQNLMVTSKEKGCES